VIKPEFGQKIFGRYILQNTEEGLEQFSGAIKERKSRVAIVYCTMPNSRSEPAPAVSAFLAAEVSTRSKVKLFNSLGLTVDVYQKDWKVPTREFESLLLKLDRDEATRAIIVQYPLRERLQPLLTTISKEKDIDGLWKGRELYGPATSEVIVRLVDSFLGDRPIVAVVGSRGFVGRGVISLLEQKEVSILPLDIRDKGFRPIDLFKVQDADIIVSATGTPELITEKHLRRHHRLVVDCGFAPRGNEVYGDVKKSAYTIPQHITPVPGGTGPMEMAVLAERVIEKELSLKVVPWRLEQKEFLTREQVIRHWQEFRGKGQELKKEQQRQNLRMRS
jgi:methylenetetrahydrofolate dehydrogenase (NADP+) / methenyltetrahydrofolate cyclohydrolase